jgi:hypothetical protein
LAAAATLLRHLGGAYLDFAKNLGVGVDGVYVKSFDCHGKRIRVELVNQLALLPSAYDSTYPIQFRIEGLAAGIPAGEGVRLEIGPSSITKVIPS